MVSNQPPPPPGRGGIQPDAIAPDGSEIRLLIDDRHGATSGSLVEVTLPAGQVSRPVWHRTVEEVWYVLEGRGKVWALSGRRPRGICASGGCVSGRRRSHTNRVAVPVQFRPRNSAPVPLLHHPTLARRSRSRAVGGRWSGTAYGLMGLNRAQTATRKMQLPAAVGLQSLSNSSGIRTNSG